MKTLKILASIVCAGGIITILWVVLGAASSSMPLKSLLLYVHLGVLAVALVGILMADHMGFRWIVGKEERIDAGKSLRLHYMVAVSMSLLIVSGIWLFWPMREYLLAQPLFLTKIGLITALVINSLMIERLMPIATLMPFAQVSSKQKMHLFLSGAISTTCWLGTIVVAYLLFGWLF